MKHKTYSARYVQQLRAKVERQEWSMAWRAEKNVELRQSISSLQAQAADALVTQEIYHALLRQIFNKALGWLEDDSDYDPAWLIREIPAVMYRVGRFDLSK